MNGKAIIGVFISLAGICVVAFCAYLVLILDPFNWGEVHSAKFSWKKFSQIKEGDAIGNVVELLGEPVEPPKPFSFILASASDPCGLGSCRRYLFSGAAWGSSYKEAIVIVDSKGRVVESRVRQE
jgi:hypothetical protein